MPDKSDVERLSDDLHHYAIQAGLAGRDDEMDTLRQAADFLPQLWHAGYRSGHTDGLVKRMADASAPDPPPPADPSRT